MDYPTELECCGLSLLRFDPHQLTDKSMSKRQISQGQQLQLFNAIYLF